MFTDHWAGQYESCVYEGDVARICVGAVIANDNSDPRGAQHWAAQREETVTVRTVLEKSNVQVCIKVPVVSYRGVVIATHVSNEGELNSYIELIHEDERLNYRLFSEKGNTHCVAEWQHWGKRLGLPLLIKAGNKDLIAYSQKVDGVILGAQAGQARSRGRKTNRSHF